MTEGDRLYELVLPTAGDVQPGEPQAQGDSTPTKASRRDPNNKTNRIREERQMLDLAEKALKEGNLDAVLPLIDKGAEITPPGAAKAEVQLVARVGHLRNRLKEVRTESPRSMTRRPRRMANSANAEKPV